MHAIKCDECGRIHELSTAFTAFIGLTIAKPDHAIHGSVWAVERHFCDAQCLMAFALRHDPPRK